MLISSKIPTVARPNIDNHFGNPHNNQMTEHPESADLINRGAGFINNHWLAVINAFTGIYVLLALSAPLFLGLGLNAPANLLYRIYSPTCHQLAFRSIFIGGDQIVYPRAHAHTLTNIKSFEDYAAHLEEFHDTSLDGLGSDLMVTARRFTGDAEMGYKSAICQRDLAIFGSLFAGGVLIAWFARRRDVPMLPIWLFVLVGLAPIALDGFSQLFSYYIPSLAYRESPPYLRIGTGFLFGFSLAWVLFPWLLDGRKNVESREQQDAT